MSDLTPTPEHYAAGFAPVVQSDARILILGTLPGVASIKQQQYYAHPQNAFWQILQQLFNIPVHAPYAERCKSVLEHQLAIWDVCHAAQRIGSLDSSIQGHSIIANNINHLLTTCPHITLIAFNGQAAARLFNKHIHLTPVVPAVTLPSTSPANARLSFEQKLLQWAVLKQHTK